MNYGFVAVTAVLLANTAAAVETEWSNAGSGSFSDASNWSLGVPGVADDALFNSSSDYTVQFPGVPVTIHRFELHSGNTIFDLSGSSLSLTSDYDNFSFVAEDSTDLASLTITNGELIAEHLQAGFASGSTGSLYLSDPTAVLNVSKRLWLGGDGVGRTFLSNGASLNIAADGYLEILRGTLRISDAATSASMARTSVGNKAWQSNGHLIVENGASPTGERFYLGRNGSSILLDGAGTDVYLTGELKAVAGQFTVQNGATLSVDRIQVENDPFTADSVNFLLDGPGTTLTARDDRTTLAYYGIVDIQITNGAELILEGGSIDDTVLGGSPFSPNFPDGDAHLLIDGAGSRLLITNSTFEIGGLSSIPGNYGSPAQIEVLNGAALEALSDVRLNTNSSITVGNGSSLIAGSLKLRFGGDLIVEAGGRLQTYQVDTDFNQQQGIHELGFLDGRPRTSINGDLTLGAGVTLRGELDGLTPDTEYERMTVWGTANLDGTLELVFGPDFQLQPGYTFDVLSAPYIVGQFAAVTATSLNMPDQTVLLDIEYLRRADLDDLVRVTVLGSEPGGDPIPVLIDINPWQETNDIQPSSTRSVVVAIHSTAVADGDASDFDATQVQPSSVRFGPAQALNISNPWIDDVDGDSDPDMILAFGIQDTGVSCDDTELSLTGITYPDNDSFSGTDSITTTDCETSGCHP